MNKGTKLYSLAFADDFVANIAGRNPTFLRDTLQDLVNRIDKYYKTWFLKINPEKCETILFRRLMKNINNKEKEDINDFSISIIRHNAEPEIIPHRNHVIYLGTYIDHMLRLAMHQHRLVEKAKNAFFMLHNFFYNRHLSTKAKIICYQLLILTTNHTL